MPEPVDKKKQAKKVPSAVQNNEARVGIAESKESKSQIARSTKISNPAKEDAAESLENSTRKKTQIESHMSDLDSTIKTTDQELEAKEREIESNVDAANIAINAMKESAKDSVTKIEENVNTASGNLDKALGKLKLAARIITIAVIGVYYSVYVLEKGLAYDPSIYGGVAIAAVLTTVFWAVISKASKDLKDTETQATERMKTTREGLGGFLTTKIGIEHNMKRVKTNFSRVASYGQTILSAMRDWIPALEKAYATRDRLNRQEVFKKSLRNALVTYGFELKGRVDDYFSDFGPLTESANEWLEEAAGKLGPMLDASPQLLSLIYFDYTGDLEGKKNAWKTINSESSLLSELAKLLIRNKLVGTEYIEEDLEKYGAIEEIIKGETPFSLESFREKYITYYIDFVREKITVIDSLREYGTKISTTAEQRIKKFTPESLDQDRRLAGLFDAASTEVGVSPNFVQLAYFERETEVQKRDHAWTGIKSQEKTLLAFVAKLVTDKLVDVPSQYVADHDALHRFIADILKPSDSFTLAGAKRTVQVAFDSLDLEKETFLRLMSNRIILSEPDRKEFAKWLPVSISPEETAKWVQGRTGIPHYVMMLLYYDYVQDSRARKRQFDSMRDDERMRELSKTLLERSFIPSTESTDAQKAIPNLALLLMKVEDFDRPAIQSKFAVYNQLMDYAADLLVYLKEQKIVAEEVRTSFEDVLEAVKITETNALAQEQIVIDRMIKTHGVNQFNSSDWHQPIVMATLALFLATRELQLSRAACKSAGTSEKASKILYQYSRINDEELQRGATIRTPFAEIIQKTIDASYTNYDYLVPFRDELTSGFLFLRISHLLHARLDAIDKKIGDKSKLEEVIKKYSKAANTFLDSKLKTQLIIESLRMQLINAYMITKLGAADVITGIVDVELPKACEELAKDNPVYSNLILLSEETLGPGTRIGIVPFQMDFTTFSKYFETAFRLAVEKHRQSGTAHPLEEFSANAVRFFPSDAYFKRVEGMTQTTGAFPKDHPAEIIRKLVLKYYGPVENLELIASLRGEFENEMALRSLVSTHFDTDTQIYLWAESQLNGLIGGSRFLDYIKDGPFDKELWLSFNCQTRSQLALAVYDASGRDDVNASIVLNKVKFEVERLAKQSGAKLDKQQIEGVSTVVFQVLHDIGMVLRGYA